MSIYRPLFTVAPRPSSDPSAWSGPPLPEGVGKPFLGTADTPEVPSTNAFAYVRVSTQDQVGPDRTGLPRELMHIDT